MAQLPADEGRGEPCGLARRCQRDLEVALAQRQVVRDAVDPRHGRHAGSQLRGGGSQRLHVVVLERVGDARSHVDAPRANVDLFQVRQGADGPSPGPLDLHRGRRALGPFVEVQAHRGEMTAVQLLADLSRRLDIADDHADRVDGCPLERIVDAVPRFHEALGRGDRLLEWRARRQVEVRLHVVGAAQFLVEHDDAHGIGADEQHGGDQNDDAANERQPDIAHGPRCCRGHDPVANLVQPSADLALHIAQRREAPAPPVRQVRRQYEERGNQRNEQDEDRNVGEDVDDLIRGRGDEEKGQEGQNRRDGADGQRPHHGPRARDGRVERALSPLAFRRDALAHHDGVVDDDADQQEEAEDRAEVERQVRRVEEHQRPDEGQGDADGHPQRDAELEDENEGDEHQDDADRPRSSRSLGGD